MKCKRCGREYESDKILEYKFTMTGDLMIHSPSGISMNATTQLCNICRKYLEVEFAGQLVYLMHEYGLDDHGEFVDVDLNKLAKFGIADDKLGIVNDTHPKFKVIEGGKNEK